jgi:ATP-dependent protease HslVU (ClpYQ) peptidase subunit
MSLKTYKENFNEEVTNFIVTKLKESGVSKGQIRIQIEDRENSMFTSKEDITENEPVIVSTGSGIMFATKKNF